MDARGYGSDGELEAVSGVSASLISRYQSGDISPTVQNLRKLAPFLKVTLGELMVEAGLATAEELGVVAHARPPEAETLDRSLLEAQRLLADPALAEEAKDYLRDTIRMALAYWRQQLGLQAPREPSAADRAAGRKVRAD